MSDPAVSGPALLAFDPAVPQRDRLLDPAALQDRLSALAPPGPVTWRVAKVKYHVGRDLRVVYGAYGGAAPRLVAARTRPKSPDVRFSAFPRDRRLPALPALMAPDADLASLLGGAWTASDLRGYAPEKSAVVACMDGTSGPVAYAKLFADHVEARKSFEVHRIVARSVSTSMRALRTPRPILRVEPQHVVITEAARGRPLIECAGATCLAGVALMGMALAELHGSSIELAGTAAARTADTRLADAARVIACVRPDLARAATTAAERLAASRPSPGPVVPLHGDVHLKNALLDGDRVWLIDLDQAHAGPAAEDLGSFLAALRTDALVDAAGGVEAARLAHAFLRGYASVRALPSVDELHWHTSAALLAERALRAVTRIRRDVLAHLPALLHEATPGTRGDIA